MRKLFFALLLCFVFTSIQTFSQVSNFTVSGTILDKNTNERIEYPSVRVLNPQDSTLVAGGSAGKGSFSYTLKPGDYVIKVSFLGYLDYIKRIKVNRDLNLGNILLEENSVQLAEAVVETNAIEVMVKGDTIEYNANAYKVQESAVVEDLLKKMPGVEIDEDGKITVHGKEVKKIMLEGKEFFSDDPKVASKNLPAQMVDKLQVLDKKSDMALMTGFDDGDEETVINLIARPGMKQGAFGNLLGGYGSEGRYETNGMFNFLRNNTQISVLGGINNTNNAGMTDLGSAMFGNSGGGRGGNRSGGNSGETKAITGGINFATEHSDKLKWGGDVRYGNNNRLIESHSRRENISGKNPGMEISDSWDRSKGDNFAANLRFEWTPDSLTKVIFRPRVEYNTTDNNQTSTTVTTYEEGAKLFGKDNTSLQRYTSIGTGYKLNGNLDMSRKLNSKGRVLSLGLRGGYSKTDNDGFDFNKIDYSNVEETDSIIDQRFFQENENYNWRAFASWVEPLKGNNYLELSYNISGRNSITDKSSFTNAKLPDLEVTPDYSILDTANTRFVENNFINQNVSLKFRAQRRRENGHTYNYMLGVGLEPSSSKTTLREPGGVNKNVPRRSFLSFAPTGDFNYYWDRRHNLRISYNGTTTEPTSVQLYDGVYSRNGLNTTSGNPNLKPSYESRLNVRYRKFNPERESFMALNAQFTHTANDIISTSTSNANNGGKDRSYANVNGNMGGNMRFMFNTPFKSKKWSVNSMSFVSYNINNTLVDDDKNKAKTLTLQESMGIRFRSDIFETSLRGNIRYVDMKSSIQTRNNQSTFNYGGTYDFTFYVPNPMRGVPFFEHLLSDLTIESDLKYSTNSGYSDGFKQQEWLWNASISKQVFKNKAGTIRFKMYDILKERSSITRRNDPTYIEDITTNIIPSYFMVHFVYRFQIFKGGVKMQDMQGSRGPREGGRPSRH